MPVSRTRSTDSRRIFRMSDVPWFFRTEFHRSCMAMTQRSLQESSTTEIRERFDNFSRPTPRRRSPRCSPGSTHYETSVIPSAFMPALPSERFAGRSGRVSSRRDPRGRWDFAHVSRKTLTGLEFSTHAQALRLRYVQIDPCDNGVAPFAGLRFLLH